MEYNKILQAEIEQGWMFALPIEYINSLHHGALAPVGIDDKVQSDLPDGSCKVKYRLTHDQSFDSTFGTLVNDRVISEKLNTLLYGGCFSRLVHYIVDLTLHHPTNPILGGKSDFKAVYRRVSLHGDIAKKCAIMYEKLALPSLRLTFGGSPSPNHFCLFSELSIDLANELLHCHDWDPNLLCSPHTSKNSDPIIKDPTNEFAIAKPLDAGKIDVFIDHGIAITPDLNDNRNREIQAMLLAIHTICHPLDPNEPIKRDDCLSLGKLEEEGQL